MNRYARRNNVRVIDKTTRFDQLNGVEGATTAIALVASSVLETTVRTNSFDIAVGQEPKKKSATIRSVDLQIYLGHPSQ